MKVQDYSQMIGHITRDKTTDVPGSMAHELRTNPSSMVQGPRNMYAGGQLVSNTVDGSRPGYSGPEKTLLQGFSKEKRELYNNQKLKSKIIELVKKEPKDYSKILEKINSYKNNIYKYDKNTLSSVINQFVKDGNLDVKYAVEPKLGIPQYTLDARNAKINNLVSKTPLPTAKKIAEEVGTTITTVTNYLKKTKGEEWVDENYGKSRYLRYGETPLKKQFLDFVNNNPVENFTFNNILKNTDIKTKKEANSIFSKLMGDIYDKRAPNVDRPVHYIDKNINLKDLTKKLRSSDDFYDAYERKIGSLLLEAYDGNLNSKEYKKARETLTAYHNLIRPLNKKYPSIAQTIEHPIPYTFLTEVSAGKDPKSLINTTILGDKENTFKSKIDKVKIELRRNLEKNPNDKKFLAQLEDMKKLETFLTKETGMGFGTIKTRFTDPKVQDLNFGVETFGKKKIVPQIKKSLEVREKAVDFFNKFKNNPKVINLFENAGVGAKVFRMLGGLRKGNVPLFLKEMDNILKKNPALKDKLAELPMFDEYSDIKNQYAALDTGTMSDVNINFSSPGSLKKEVVPAEAIGAATLPIAAQGKKIVSGLGKAVKTLGTRAGVTPFAGYTIYDNLKKGENVVDATLDPWVGAELMLPNMFKENVAKITSSPKIQKLLSLGYKIPKTAFTVGRAFTPIGAGITAAGLGIDAYKYGKKRIAELKAMSPEERAKLAQERDDFSFGEYSGAAEGGIASLNVKK